jgi:hypothetical protein
MWLNAAVLGGDTPWTGGGSALRVAGETYSTFVPCSAKCTAHCKVDVNDIIPQPMTFSLQSLYQCSIFTVLRYTGRLQAY